MIPGKREAELLVCLLLDDVLPDCCACMRAQSKHQETWGGVSWSDIAVFALLEVFSPWPEANHYLQACHALQGQQSVQPVLPSCKLLPPQPVAVTMPVTTCTCVGYAGCDACW